MDSFVTTNIYAQVSMLKKNAISPFREWLVDNSVLIDMDPKITFFRMFLPYFLKFFFQLNFKLI